MVGIIFENAAKGATAYPVDKIKQIMAKWNYQWQMNLNPNNSKNLQTENIDISKGTGVKSTLKPKSSFSKKVLFSSPVYNASYELYSDKIVLHIFSYNSSPWIAFDVNQNNLVDAMLDRAYGITGNNNICTQFLLSETSSTTCGGAPSNATLSIANGIYTFTIPLNEVTSSSNVDSVSLRFTFSSSERGDTYFPSENGGHDLRNVYKISL
jgi:hypothetical protein